MMKKVRFILFSLPLLLFILIVIFFRSGLGINPQILPSPLLDKPVPDFSLPTVQSSHQVDQKIFLGHVSLLNVFATWCETCATEHPFLVDLAQQKHISLYGLDYKDNRQAAATWLTKYGNPYAVVLFDGSGQTAINWGVYGTPETFLIDSKGIIRYKVVGQITPEVWQQQLLPRIEQLQNIAERK